MIPLILIFFLIINILLILEGWTVNVLNPFQTKYCMDGVSQKRCVRSLYACSFMRNEDDKDLY